MFLCYGIEVDDFHTLDKSKLFALHFSATQEIDRIQQQHIIDISNAQATIQSHEATIQQQQLEIEIFKSYKSRHEQPIKHDKRTFRL